MLKLQIPMTTKFTALFGFFLFSKLALAAPVPAEIQSQTPRGALSLHFETRNIGPKSAQIGLHLSVVPTGRDLKSAESIGATLPKGPITRAELRELPSPLLPSLFTLEIFARQNGKWRRINAVTFSQTKDLQKIETRWLDPKTKTKPVLALHFGYTHWHEWEILTFANGLARPAQTQTFYWGGEGEWDYLTQNLDRTDAQGQMIIAESEGNSAPDGKSGVVSRRIYRFDGREWRDFAARYFVIAASLKTRADAEKALKTIGFGEIRPSAHYSKLKPGYFVIILARFATLKDANQRSQEIRRDGKIKPSVRLAF